MGTDVLAEIALVYIDRCGVKKLINDEVYTLVADGVEVSHIQTLTIPIYANQPLLHRAIIRPAAAFGADPSDVLGGVFDVAGFAVHAVGGVDL